MPQTSLATSADTVFADTITVTWPDGAGGDGRMEHRQVRRGLNGSPEILEWSEVIRVQGNAMIFVPPACGGPFVDCFYAERTGVVTGNTLTISFTDPGFRSRMYVRF